MNLCVIPARGGSKRIPRKNIKDFLGKPMIAYSIEKAIKSKLFDYVVVSTDDDEIAQVARRYGAQTPFVRSPQLSDDYAPTVPVVADTILKCNKFGWYVDYVCCIYPCAPLLQPDDLIAALKLLQNSDAQFAFPIVEFETAVERALRLDLNGLINPKFSFDETVRTQDYETSYRDAGQFYWGRVDAWLSGSKIHSNSLGLNIPKIRAIDIDTQDDWALAELIGQNL